MEKQFVLVVEDDEDIQQLVSYNLLKAGFLVDLADTGELALEKVREKQPDLILLDIMLPGIDGLETVKLLRAEPEGTEVPVIMLTAKSEEMDVVAGLQQGADDYVTKPFSVEVLLARIKAVLRRRDTGIGVERKSEDEDVIRLGEMVINSTKHEVNVRGNRVDLTPTEFNILSLLAKKPGWVFSRQQIINSVRGHDYLLTSRAMDVQIFGLRKKLGAAGSKIETVRGIGYRLSDE